MKTHASVLCVALIALSLASPISAKPGGGNGGGPPSPGGSAPGNSAVGRGAIPDRPAHIGDIERRAEPPSIDRPDKPGKVDPLNHPSRSAAAPARELSNSMHAINQTAFAERRQLLDSVDMRLESSRDAMKQVQANAKNLRAEARDDFKIALEAVKTRETELASALKAARKADEANWEVTRGALARAHDAHATAVAHLERLAPPKL